MQQLGHGYALRAIQSIAYRITSALFLLPLIIWLTLYLAQRWWSVNLRPALPWFKTLRWVGWTFGVALLLLSLTGGHFVLDLRHRNDNFLGGTIDPRELDQASISRQLTKAGVPASRKRDLPISEQVLRITRNACGSGYSALSSTYSPFFASKVLFTLGFSGKSWP